MRVAGLFLLTVIGSIGLLGQVAWLSGDPAVRQVILVSGAVAVPVQMSAFAVARALRAKNLMLGWGLGSLIRVISLVLYAVVVARLWRANLTPALLSFAAFLFVTTVVEPLFLKR